MRLDKTGSSPGIEAAVTSGVSFEAAAIAAGIAKRSERRARIAAWAAVAFAIVLANGFFFSLSLKEKLSSLVMGDAYTGNSTVPPLRDDFKNRSVTTSEFVNRNSLPTTFRGVRPSTPLSGNAAILRGDHVVEVRNAWQLSAGMNKVSS